MRSTRPPDVSTLGIGAGNRTLWTLQYRQSELNPATNRSLAEDDIMMNSRYLGYPLSVKGLAFLPSLLGFAMFGVRLLAPFAKSRVKPVGVPFSRCSLQASSFLITVSKS